MIELLLIFLFGSRVIEIHNPPIQVEIRTVTGYSSEISQTDSTPFLTASQKQVKEGMIACPRRLPFGTIVEIEGKEYQCEDRLSLKYDNRYDIWFPSTVEAREFGIQELPIIIK
mgnify:CR=1 FL=1